VTEDSRRQGTDPVADFQRWLMRSGARGLGREVRGNLRKTFGYGDAGRDDVWGSATNEPESGDPPECEWCPLCRAARKLRDSGPGLSSHLSTAGDVFATVVQDAVNAFEAVIATGPGAGTARPGPGAGPPSAGPPPDGASAGPSPDDAGAGPPPDDAEAGPPPDDAEPLARPGELPERPADGPVDRS